MKRIDRVVNVVDLFVDILKSKQRKRKCSSNQLRKNGEHPF